MAPSDLIPEIWYLIFKALPTRNDLRNVCSVSRLFDALATPILYRSVIFRRSLISGDWLKFPNDDDVETQDEAGDLSFGLFYRLLDDRNERLRAFVHEITIKDVSDGRTWQKLEPPEDLLTRLVKKLPNLEDVYFGVEIPVTESFVDLLLNHKSSPKLHLLGENGRTQVNVKMPFVQELHTQVDATATSPGMGSTGRPLEPQKLAMHELFTAYPNLENLSVSVNRLRGGCVMGGIPCTSILPLSLSKQETFPPLQSLSLSGYHITGEEVSLWRDKFPWHNLRSLSLGPQDNLGFLELATGNVHGLNNLTVTSYHDFDSKTKLDALLSSFNTLRSLTVKGYIPSLAAVAHHPNLRHLCLHEIEHPDRERRTLNTKEIEDLDQHCPELTALKIDLNPDGTLPDDLVTAIASGFNNLRRLSIHVGLGIAHVKEMADMSTMRQTFASVLTESTAQDFAKRFFDRRASSALGIVSLKTGEKLRWFPQWHPGYANAESDCAKKFEIYAPPKSGDMPRFKELESESVRMRREIELNFARLWEKPKLQRISRAPRVL